MDHIFATYDWRRQTPDDPFTFCPHCTAALEPQEQSGRTRPVCPECGFVRYRNPFPAVALLMVQGDRVVLGRRVNDPGRGKWALPSGYVEFSDDFLTTAVREAREETGLEVEFDAIVHVQSGFMPGDCHYLTVYLLTTVTGGELAARDDLDEVAWFSVHEPLPELAFPPEGELIVRYARGELARLPLNSTGQEAL